MRLASLLGWMVARAGSCGHSLAFDWSSWDILDSAHVERRRSELCDTAV